MKIKELLEDVQYPEVVDARYIIDVVYGIHHNQMDFEDGDIMNRIYKYDQYKLCQIPLSRLDVDEFDVEPETVGDYSKLTSKAPPIVVTANKARIIDGTHRAQAAILRGGTTILAYVGAKVQNRTI